MPLSPHEEQLLATLEAELRADDPALAATLEPARPDAASHALLPPRGTLLALVTLLLALLGLVAASTLLGDRLGLAGTAALTGALLVPWLVLTARALARSGTAAWTRRQALVVGGPWTRSGIVTTAVLAVAVVALLPPSGRAVVGLVITFVVLPWMAMRTVKRVERAMRTGRRGERDPGAGPT